MEERRNLEERFPQLKYEMKSAWAKQMGLDVIVKGLQENLAKSKLAQEYKWQSKPGDGQEANDKTLGDFFEETWRDLDKNLQRWDDLGGTNIPQTSNTLCHCKKNIEESIVKKTKKSKIQIDITKLTKRDLCKCCQEIVELAVGRPLKEMTSEADVVHAVEENNTEEDVTCNSDNSESISNTIVPKLSVEEMYKIFELCKSDNVSEYEEKLRVEFARYVPVCNCKNHNNDDDEEDNLHETSPSYEQFIKDMVKTLTDKENVCKLCETCTVSQ